MANSSGYDGTLRFKTKDERVATGNSTTADFLKTVNDTHDLQPLHDHLKLVKPLPISLTDTAGKKKDFAGTDFIIQDEKGWNCQDKRRDSWAGRDLGVEFVRMYRKRYMGENLIIVDGGRDLFQIPGSSIVGQEMGNGGYTTDRNWEVSETENDLILLHPKHSDDLIWLRSESVKYLCKGLLCDWQDRCVPEQEHSMYERIMNGVFGQDRTLTMNSDLGTDFDVKCLPEMARPKRDMKNVKMQGDTAPSLCLIAKCIAYLPVKEVFKEGVDYVVCPKRS